MILTCYFMTHSSVNRQKNLIHTFPSQFWGCICELCTFYCIVLFTYIPGHYLWCQHNKLTIRQLFRLTNEYTRNSSHTNIRAANSTRIRESILATILLTYRFENQFLLLNCAQNVSVSITFDSRKRSGICIPEHYIPTSFY